MTLNEFRALNKSFYQPETAEQHSERDNALLAERIHKLNQRDGPRVGDFVIIPDCSTWRFTYDWTDSLHSGDVV